MRAYCDFYEVAPADDDLRRLVLALIAEPEHEGFQLIARGDTGAADGFATVFWSWSTLSAARIGVMNDLFVAPSARGSGLADALIAECAERCRRHGAKALEWTTAPDNRRAQAVYDRTGARAAQWVEYSLPL